MRNYGIDWRFWIVMGLIWIGLIGGVYWLFTSMGTTNAVEPDRDQIGEEYIEDEEVIDPLEGGLEEEEGWSEFEQGVSDFGEVKETEIDTVQEIEGVKTILLMGLDTRQGDWSGRTDAMVLAVMNQDKVKLVSIPRDSYVNIGGNRGYDKITHAYAYGKEELAESTVEHLLEVSIDHSVVINFESFEDAVDTLGGVEVDVPFTFSEKTTGGVWLKFNQGPQVLNGEEALAYVRMRKQDPQGDEGRGQRQQEVIKALMQEGKQMSNWTKMKPMYDIMKEHVKTDIGVLDMMGMVPYASALDTIEMVQLKGRGEKINGIYYHRLDENVLQQVKNEIQEMSN